MRHQPRIPRTAKAENRSSLALARGALNFELGMDVRPEVSTTTLYLNQRGRKFATYV